MVESAPTSLDPLQRPRSQNRHRGRRGDFSLGGGHTRHAGGLIGAAGPPLLQQRGQAREDEEEPEQVERVHQIEQVPGERG